MAYRFKFAGSNEVFTAPRSYSRTDTINWLCNLHSGSLPTRTTEGGAVVSCYLGRKLLCTLVEVIPEWWAYAYADPTDPDCSDMVLLGTGTKEEAFDLLPKMADGQPHGQIQEGGYGEVINLP